MNIISDNFLKFGDEIYLSNEILLESSNLKKKTYLLADILGNTIWDIPDSNDTIPIEFDQCIFTICPKLSYVDKENKTSKIKELSNEETEGNDVGGDEYEEENDNYEDYDNTFKNRENDIINKKKNAEKKKQILKELEERVVIEDNRNLQIMTTTNGTQLLYGTIVQLQHKKSGKYLCTKRSCAKYDKTCLGLELSDGSTLCHFMIMPKYKVRSEGGLVLINDEIALSAVDPTLSGYYLHGSPPENDDIGNNIVKVDSGFEAFESKSGFLFFEANLSRDFQESGVVVSLHTRSLITENYLRTGDAISFWAADAEAFIEASIVDDLKNQQSKSKVSTFSRVVVGSRLSDISNKLNPSCFNSKAVWSFEKMERQSGGLLEWKTHKYRIRHIATNNYLTVTSDIFKSEQDLLKEESKEKGIGSMIGNKKQDNDEIKLKLDLTPIDEKEDGQISQAFTLSYVEKSSPFVPNDEVLVVLTHVNKEGKEFFVHVHQEGKIERNIAKERIQLIHQNETSKKSSSLLKALKTKNDGFNKNAKVIVRQSGDSEEYRGKIFKVNNDGTFDIFRKISDISIEDRVESQINRFVYVSSKKRIADALILVKVDPERQAIVEFLSSAHPVCEYYYNFVIRESPSGKELSARGKKIDFDFEQFVLKKLILGSVGYKDYTGDYSKIMGRPVELFQNAARDQRILEGLIKMATAPFLAEPFISLEKDGDDVDAWKDPRFGVLSEIHINVWTAVRLLVKGNHTSEQHVIDLKAKIKKLNADQRNMEVEKFKLEQYKKDLSEEEKFNFDDKVTTRRLSVNTFNKLNNTEALDDTPKKKGILSNMMSNSRRKSVNPAAVQSISEVSKASGAVVNTTKGTYTDVSGIDVLIQQLPFPVGASKTLTTIIDENISLLKKVTAESSSSESITQKFKVLIKDEGPIKEALNFFTAICACDKKFIRSNQDLLVHELLEDKGAKASYLFEFSLYPDGADTSKLLYKKYKMSNISSTVVDKISHDAVSVILGHEIAGEESEPIFVKWKGSNDWRAGMDALYHDAESVGLRFVLDEKGGQWVLLQDLCQPLSSKFSDKMKNSSNEKSSKFKRLILERQKVIATYFIEYINLMAEMCGGRSHTAQVILQKEFTFQFLLKVISDTSLPFPALGAFIKLTNNLYISQYPHAENCGRQTIPKRIWIEQELDEEYIDMFSKSSAERATTAEKILPHFIEIKNHNESDTIFFNDDTDALQSDDNNPKPLKYKFNLLVAFITDFFDRVLANSKESNDKKKTLTSEDVIAIRETVEMARLLCSYGFIPDLTEVDNLSDLLHKLLESITNTNVTGKQRYDERDVMNYNCMQTKTEILKLLLFEELLKNEIQLAGFLSVYKEREQRGPSQCITDILNISKLQHDDSSSLDKQLLDLLLHDDDDLFVQAFLLFQARKSSLRTLLDNASKVKLLSQKEILKTISLENLDYQASDWKRLFENFEQWSRSSIKSLHVTLKYANDLLDDKEKVLHQEILTLMDFHTLLLLPLKIDNDDLKRVDSVIVNDFHQVQSTSLEVLIKLVDGNKTAAESISKDINSLTTKLLEGSKVVSESSLKWDVFLQLVVAVFQGSKNWIMRTPKIMFRNLPSILLLDEKKINIQIFSLCLDFYMNQLLENSVDSFSNEPSPRNQNLVFEAIDSIVSKNNTQFMKEIDYESILSRPSSDQFEKYVNYLKFIKILSLLSLDNPAASNNSMNSIIKWDLLAVLIIRFSNSMGSMLPEKVKSRNSVEDENEFLTAHIDLFHNAFCDQDTYDEDIIFNKITMKLTEKVIELFDEAAGLIKGADNETQGESFSLKNDSYDNEPEVTFDKLFINHDNDDDIEMVSNGMISNIEIDNPMLMNMKAHTEKMKPILSRYKLIYSCLSYLKSYNAIYCDALDRENVKIKNLKKVFELFLTSMTIYDEIKVDDNSEQEEEKSSNVLSGLAFLGTNKSGKSKYRKLTLIEERQKASLLVELNKVQRELSSYSYKIYQLASEFGKSIGVQIKANSPNENTFNKRKKGSGKGTTEQSGSSFLLTQRAPVAENLEDFVTFVKDKVKGDLERDDYSLVDDFFFTSWKKVDQKEQLSYLNSHYDSWLSEKEKSKKTIYAKFISLLTPSPTDEKSKSVGAAEDDSPGFQELIERMIKFVSKTVKLNQDHVITMPILNIFKSFLLIGEKNDIKRGGIDGVSQFSIEELTSRQITLSNLNLMKMLHELLSSENSPNDVFLEAASLASLMLKNGTRAVQDALLKRMKRKDSEGKFFSKIKDSFTDATKYICRNRFSNTSDDEEYKRGIDDDNILKKVELVSILPFLTQFCEGHYREAQEILLSQQNYSAFTFNIIEAAYSTLFSIVPSIEIFTKLTRVHSEILLLLLDFLSEAIQGPCQQNQSELIRLNIFATCRIILICPQLENCYSQHGDQILKDPDCKPKHPILTLIKAKTVVLLSALVEGPINKDFIEDLSGKIESAVFKTAQSEVLKAVKGETNMKSRVRGKTARKKSSMLKFLTKFSVFAREDSFNAFDSEKNQYVRNLAASTTQLLGITAKVGLLQPDLVKTIEDIKTITVSELETIHQRIYNIEVMWDNTIHEVFFVVPIKCRYLSEMTKEYFLENEVSVDNNSCDSRKKQLMDKKDIFIDEMDVFYNLGSTIPFFRFLLRHSLQYKKVLFGISVLLNFHIMIASLSLDVLVVSKNTSINGEIAFTVKVILGIIIIILHIILFLFYIVAGFDLKRRSLNRSMEFGKMIVEKNGNQKIKLFEWDKLIMPMFLSLFYIGGCIIHFYNFEGRHSVQTLRRVYVYIYIFIFIPLIINQLRQCVRYPTNSLSFYLSLVVDTVTISSVATSAFFVAVSYCGLCYHYAFFSLLLVDFLNISEDAANTVRSITTSSYPLMNLVVIFLIVIIIYAIYAYAYFGNNSFIDGDGNHCESLLSCIGLSLYNAILNGNLVGAMESADMTHASDSFAARFFYDILFAITVGQLLMNMVTGIITDAFGGLRGNTDSRRAMYKSESFIAGLTEADLDSVPGIYPSDLDEQQHNIWSYIYYAAYIESRDPTNDTGLESYVRDCLNKKEQSWLPHKNCYSLQAQKLLSGEKTQQSLSDIEVLKALILQAGGSPNDGN